MKETRSISKREVSKKLYLLLFFIFSLSISSALAQTTVTGVVTDQTKDPLPGVSVVVKGSTTGTVTDFDGNYTITVKAGDVLDFSFLGMKPQSIAVAGKTKINVVLEDDAQMLGETVVIGYGTAKAKDLTSPIAVINSEDVGRHLTASPMQGLQGKVAGLQITNTGAPGSSPQVRIRGVGSLENGKNNPLYVVDGMFLDNIDFLSNNDIVNISVMKDASAAAIYGVRAANGVIIVTTKTGGMNRPTEVTYDGFMGVQTVSNLLKMSNTSQYTQFINESKNDVGIRALNRSMDRFGGTDGVPNTDTDWFSELLRPAFMNSHSINVSGGSDKAAYVVSTNYLNQKGLVDANNGFERLNVRAQVDANVYSWFKVGANMLLVNSNNRTVDNGAIFHSAYQTPSIIPIYDENNTQASPIRFANARSIMDDAHFTNPMATATFYNNLTKDQSILPTLYAQFTLLDDKLTLRSSFNQKVTNRTNNVFRPAFFVADNQQRPLSQLESINTNENSWLVDNVATYRDTFKKDHNYTLMLGQSVRRYGKREMIGRANNVPNEEHLWAINNGDDDGTRTLNGTRNSNATVSVFGRLMYDYKSRYLLSATFRADGSSKYTERWGYFPSLGLGWVLNEEEFMKNQHIFDFLKLRASWGQLGNDNVSSNPGFTISPTSVVFDGRQIPGTSVFSLYAPTKWEVVEETNAGLDFASFNHRLTGELDYFSRKTQNAILHRALPLVTDRILVNAGAMRNSGFELTLNWNDAIGKDIKYNVGFNMSTLKNEVLSLGDGRPQEPMNDFVIRRVGEAVNSFYGYKVIGVYQTQKEIDDDLFNMPANDRPQVGDFKYAHSSEGTITGDDREILGSPLPKLFIGGNLGLDYKNFDFNVAMQGNFGGKIINKRRFDRMQHPLTNIDEDLFKNRWTGEGSSNTHTSSEGLFRTWNYGRGGSLSSNFVESSSMFAIQNIQVGYTFHNVFPKSQNKSLVRLNFTAERPFTFFSYNGFTPEITDQWGYDSGIYPLASVFSFGVKILY